MKHPLFKDSLLYEAFIRSSKKEKPCVLYIKGHRGRNEAFHPSMDGIILYSKGRREAFP